MTSRLIRPGPPDLLFNSIPGQSGVFQPPGPLHQVTQVAAHGKRAGPLVGFYHSAGQQPANSTPVRLGAYSKCAQDRSTEIEIRYDCRIKRNKDRTVTSEPQTKTFRSV